MEVLLPESMKHFFTSLGLCSLSGVLFFLSIHWWWPLVFVSLTPLAVCFCRASRWWTAGLWAAVSGTLMWYFIQYPLWTYNEAGIAILAAYQSLSLVVMAVGVRAIWQRWQLSLVLLWPLAVVSGEYLRMIGLLGVPFGSLAGACREQNWMLQVCDLGGIYTLSVPIAMVQGWIAEVFLTRSFRWSSLVSVACAWVAVALYGHFRSAHIESEMVPGPRVAVIQPDVVHVLHSPHGYDPDLILKKLKDLTEQAAGSGDAPDLFVWPEGISSFPLFNREFIEAPHDLRTGISAEEWNQAKRERRSFEKGFTNWVREIEAPLIVGMDSYLPAAAGEAVPFLRYNSARIYDPEIEGREEGQFKMRLYPGGEYFPWAGSWLDRKLGERKVLPSVFGVPNKFEPGRERKIFELKETRYAISICSEILVPKSTGVFHPARDGKKPFEFLVNIANEGPFLRNEAQVHQFAYLPFRAIEARVGIARSSNTGMSGFVSPTGKIYDLVTNHRGEARSGLGAPELPLIDELMNYRRTHEGELGTDPEKRKEVNRRIQEIQDLRKVAGIEGFSVAQVYLYPHRTLYQRWGDWLGVSGLTVFGFIFGGVVFQLFREARRSQ